MLIYWVKLARVQGQIYEKLFSATAFSKPLKERSQTAAALVRKMNLAWHERGQMDFTNPLSPNEIEVPSKRKRFLYEGMQNALDPDVYMQSQ